MIQIELRRVRNALTALIYVCLGTANVHAQTLQGGTGNEFPAQPRLFEVAYAPLGVLSATSKLSVRLLSQHSASCQISLSAHTSSELGAASAKNIASLRVTPSGSVTASIDVAALQLPTRTLRVAGQVLLGTRATCDDGQTWQGNAPPLFFELRGSQIEFYDDVGRKARPNKNAVAEDVRAMAALLSADSMLVPAYSQTEQQIGRDQTRDGVARAPIILTRQ